jgi:hypothetical protein
MSNITSILTKIQEVNSLNTVSAVIPSTNKSVSMLPLSVKQQKEIIKSGLEGNISGILVSNAINHILKNNCKDCQLLVIDKLPLIVASRVQAFGNIYKDKDITPILSKTLTINVPFQQKLTYKDIISAEVKIPTIDEDIAINNVLISAHKTTEDGINVIASNLYIYEIVKFIKTLSIHQGETEETVNFDELSIQQRATVVESLPANFNQLILNYIQSIRELEEKYLTLQDEPITIDVQFFTKE